MQKIYGLLHVNASAAVTPPSADSLLSFQELDVKKSTRHISVTGTYFYTFYTFIINSLSRVIDSMLRRMPWAPSPEFFEPINGK